MHGNVTEYCLDAHIENMGLTDGQFLSETPVTDPYGAYENVTDGTHRTCRGGNYNGAFYTCRSAERYDANHPDADRPEYGYRLVCPLPGETFPEPVIPAGSEE